MPDWLLVALLIAALLLVPLLGVLWIENKRRQIGPASFLVVSFGDTRLITSRDGIKKVSLLIFPLYIIYEFLPIPFIFPFLVFILFIYVRRLGTQSTVDFSERSQKVADALQKIQLEVANAKSHIEQLAREVVTRQAEIEEGNRVKDALIKEIDEKHKEGEEWQKLTEYQKELVIDVAKDAFSKKSSLQLMSVIIGSIALNLTANVVWALMGQPGGEKLIGVFEGFRTFVGL
ncbi:hypothetical protein [Mesorhizobium sp. M8A.F.Ca.ET.165.01.1.1]|uniref:coiled-coil domain-containing protein n=1 Tax=Mesorhizobium sp. M8A.F.Ca.ET.165.01.1.1 TaxID=2563960 RepID=UPI001093B332|nr:hypothetical protein [Mesorhizobium sp. M8A.F.Ca.ET.165.01.1.1]TGT40255.1 hypothetical protein EN808_16785 [Mesorhizobium sp. M8A.F.Ca.ET.165.01.1.1]